MKLIQMIAILQNRNVLFNKIQKYRRSQLDMFFPSNPLLAIIILIAKLHVNDDAHVSYM